MLHSTPNMLWYCYTAYVIEFLKKLLGISRAYEDLINHSKAQNGILLIESFLSNFLATNSLIEI